MNKRLNLVLGVRCFGHFGPCRDAKRLLSISRHLAVVRCLIISHDITIDDFSVRPVANENFRRLTEKPAHLRGRPRKRHGHASWNWRTTVDEPAPRSAKEAPRV